MEIFIDTSENNRIFNNDISNIKNAGIGIGYGIYLDANSDNNLIGGNNTTLNNNVNYLDNGTGNIL